MAGCKSYEKDPSESLNQYYSLLKQSAAYIKEHQVKPQETQQIPKKEVSSTDVMM